MDSQPKIEVSFNENYRISIDEALTNLDGFMNDSNSNLSRSDHKKKIASIKSIVSGNSHSRAGSDTVLYIVNYESNGGYAVLAADYRIKNKIIAIVDQGNISDTTQATVDEILNSTKRLIFTQYPTTGPGIFSVAGINDASFINPNTISYENVNGEGIFVGNYCLADTVGYDSMGKPILKTVGMDRNLEILSQVLCVQYAVNQIRAYGNGTDNRNPGLIYTLPGTEPPLATGDSKTIGPWETSVIKEPLLDDYKYWGQDAPFNNYYPMVRHFPNVDLTTKAKAGCVPLSIAKVMAYNQKPVDLYHDLYKINWSALKSSYYIGNYNVSFNTIDGNLSAAHLLKLISTSVDSWYFCEGTFTFPHKTTPFMKSMGYTNWNIVDYKFETIKNMINANKPLLIFSIPTGPFIVSPFNSHCWNIDGYKVKYRTIKYKHQEDDGTFSFTERYEYLDMVHCDFGWHGVSNGYYVSDVFNSSDSNVEMDSSNNGNNFDYKYLKKLIVY